MPGSEDKNRRGRRGDEGRYLEESDRAIAFMLDKTRRAESARAGGRCTR